MIDTLDLVIDSIVAREVLDSRGTPTVEAEVRLEGGAEGPEIGGAATSGEIGVCRQALEIDVIG